MAYDGRAKVNPGDIVKAQSFKEDLDPRWMNHDDTEIDYDAPDWRQQVDKWYKDHPGVTGQITPKELRKLIVKAKQS